MEIISSDIFPILDSRIQDKVRDSLTVGGDKPYIKIIALHFVKYYKLTYNIKNDESVRKILNIKNKPKYVNVRKWVGYFTYRTGKYTWGEISQYMNLAAPKGNGLNLICHQLQDELTVNKTLQKEYLIHYENLKKLFITFTLDRI